MSRKLFYLFMFLLLLVYSIQIWFILKFQQIFFEDQQLLLLLFLMSSCALGVLTYFVVLGIKSIFKYKRK